MPALLLAEELFLLVHDDETGKTSAVTAIEQGYAGALLLDLAAAELVATDPGGRLVPAHGATTEDPLLGAALAALHDSRRPRKVKHWVNRLPRAMKPLGDRIGGSLVGRGVLDQEAAKVLGLFPTTRWPEADPVPERELRARLEQTLVKGADPDLHTGLLVALLSPLGLVKTLVERPDRKVAERRAKAIAESDLGAAETSKAVKQAVQAIQSSLVMAAVIPGAVASTGS